MDRRGFLKRLGVVATAVGIAAVVPAEVANAIAEQPALPLDGGGLRPASVTAPVLEHLPNRGHSALNAGAHTHSVSAHHHDAFSVSTDEMSARVSTTGPGPASVTTTGTSQRHRFRDLPEWERCDVLRNSLRKMSALCDDAFLPSEDPEVQWRWEQVRQTVMQTYPGMGSTGYTQRIIALPAVAAAVFLPGEPGHAEWLTVRSTMLQFAERAAR